LSERTADDHRQPLARYGAMGSALRGRLAIVLFHHLGLHDATTYPRFIVESDKIGMQQP